MDMQMTDRFRKFLPQQPQIHPRRDGGVPNRTPQPQQHLTSNVNTSGARPLSGQNIPSRGTMTGPPMNPITPGVIPTRGEMTGPPMNPITPGVIPPRGGMTGPPMDPIMPTMPGRGEMTGPPMDPISGRAEMTGPPMDPISARGANPHQAFIQTALSQGMPQAMIMQFLASKLNLR